MSLDLNLFLEHPLYLLECLLASLPISLKLLFEFEILLHRTNPVLVIEHLAGIVQKSLLFLLKYRLEWRVIRPGRPSLNALVVRA